MKSTLATFLLCCIALCTGGTALAGTLDGYRSPLPAVHRPTLTHVLFLGNSYLYYNDSLHNHVRRIAEELRPELLDTLKYKSATIGGARLQHHNIDWLLEPGRIGIDDPFQVVVMQGGSAEVLSDSNRETFSEITATYADKVREAGGTPVLYMTHAYAPPHRRAREGLIHTIAPAYIEAGRKAQAPVIPVGLAFAESLRRRPDFMLHEHFDGTHPNLRGTYLAACTVYLTLYGASLEGLKYNYFDELAAEDAAYLRAVATDVTRNFFSQ